MTQIDFDIEMKRLVEVFGPQMFSKGRLALIWSSCASLSRESFRRIVDGFIRTMRTAPLPRDFTESAAHERKNEFNREVDGAIAAFDQPWNTGLQSYLAKEFPGCKTLAEAVEVRRLQIQVAKANDPNYDPMQDPKWK